MMISLTNRVMIAIGISNLGAKSYWKRVYSMLVIPMSPETTFLFQNQDKYRSYRSTYAKQIEVKKYRMNIQNQKNKDFMEKQKIDENLGKTYGAGVVLEAKMIPDWMKRAEMKTKTNPKTCSFYGYSGKHTTTKA